MPVLKYQVSLQMETVECSACGVTFGITAWLESALRSSHRPFYCPNGHSLHFAQETEAEKLRRQLAEAQNAERFWKSESERRAGQLTEAERKIRQMQTRSAAGVCPCCNRTFQQLARHMKTKHPEALKAEVRP